MHPKEKYYLNKVFESNGKRYIDEEVNISGLGLTELHFDDIIIIQSFYCHGNKLKTLKGSPKRVYGVFSCSNNELKTLEGSPEFVEEEFNCSGNLLTSLEGVPNLLRKSILCFDNPKLKTLKGLNEINDFIYLDCSLPKDDYFIQYSIMDKIRIL